MNTSDSEQPDVIPLNHLEQLREARQIILQEADALRQLADSLTTSFTDAVRLIRECRGAVVITGVGKAGLIGQKVVATLASTGTRAWFLHPTEALHGDLGCVGPDDVVLALSNSGASEEVTRLLPALQKMQVPVIAVTRDTQNELARAAAVVVPIGRHSEAGRLQLAPTVSTTAMLALGDALALVLSAARGFTQEDFARFHPAGSLGRRLCPVSEVMRTGADVRMANESETVRQVLVRLKLPGRRTGAVVVTDAEGRLAGIFTDSDLARLFEKHREHLIDGPIADVMTRRPASVETGVLLPEAVQLMSARKISELPVVDDSGRPVGLVDITDILEPAAVSQSDDGQSVLNRDAAKSA